MPSAIMSHMTNDENVKTIEDQIDYEGAIVGVPLEEWVALEEAFLRAKKQAEIAVLAANPNKKQAAIEETSRILNELFQD